MSCLKKIFFFEVKFLIRVFYEKIKKIFKIFCDFEGKNSIIFVIVFQQCIIIGCKMFYGSAILYCVFKDIKSKVNLSLNEL